MWRAVANEDEDNYEYEYVYSDDNDSAAGESDGNFYSDDNDSTTGGRPAASDGDDPMSTARGRPAASDDYDPMDMDITSQSGGGNGQGAATADSTAPSLLQSEDFGLTGDTIGAVSNTDAHSNDNNMESGDTTVKSEKLGWDPRHSLNARAATVLYRGNLRKVDLTKVDWVERYFSPVVSGVKYDTITKIPYRQKISFRDIRIKLEEQGFFILLKENGIAVDKLRFYPRAGKPALMLKKEALERNIWENLEGDGSLDRPYLVVMAPYEKRYFKPVLRLGILGADDVAWHDLPVLKIAYYRQRLSFGDIRTKLKERNDDEYVLC